MFPYVCKQTFRKLYGYITRKFLGLRMRNFQGIILTWRRIYREIFKSALVYLWWNFNLMGYFINVSLIQTYQVSLFRQKSRNNHWEAFSRWCSGRSEAATGGVLSKKVFLEILQNSQENTCARVFFLTKLQVRLQLY